MDLRSMPALVGAWLRDTLLPPQMPAPRPPELSTIDPTPIRQDPAQLDRDLTQQLQGGGNWNGVRG